MWQRLKMWDALQDNLKHFAAPFKLITSSQYHTS